MTGRSFNPSTMRQNIYLISNCRGLTVLRWRNIRHASGASVYQMSDQHVEPNVSVPLPFSKIPGPRGLKKLPYIGTMFLFHPFSKHRPETFGALASSLHDRYGPIFKARLGKDYTVFTSCIEDIQKIFHLEPDYPQRRLNDLNRIYRERKGLPQGLGTSNGPEWHALRKSLNAPLNRSKACMEYLPAQNKVTDDFIHQLEKLQHRNQGKETAQFVLDLMFKYSAESVAVVCFNERLGFLSESDDQSESSKLLGAIYTHLNSSFKTMIGVERKFLKTENDHFYQNYVKAMAIIREQSTKHVTKSRNTGRPGLVGENPAKHQNMLSTLLKIPELEVEHIVAIIESLLIAGTDSTARNLSVLFYNLAKYPDTQTQLADEIKDVLGPDGEVTAQSLAEMSFLKACVKESLRLHPPISPGTNRIMSQDTSLSGYLVPEHTSVIITSVKTSLDPKFFPDPLSFRPERWTRVDGKRTAISASASSAETVSDHLAEDPRLAALSIMPFGHGKRACVGRRFAELEIYVCVAKVLQKLKLSVDPGYKLETIYTPFVTPITPVPLTFTKR